MRPGVRGESPSGPPTPWPARGPRQAAVPGRRPAPSALSAFRTVEPETSGTFPELGGPRGPRFLRAPGRPRPEAPLGGGPGLGCPVLGPGPGGAPGGNERSGGSRGPRRPRVTGRGRGRAPWCGPRRGRGLTQRRSGTLARRRGGARRTLLVRGGGPGRVGVLGGRLLLLVSPFWD